MRWCVEEQLGQGFLSRKQMTSSSPSTPDMRWVAKLRQRTLLIEYLEPGDSQIASGLPLGRNAESKDKAESAASPG